MSRVDWTAVKAHTHDILGGIAAKIIVKYIYLHTYVCKCLFAHIHFIWIFSAFMARIACLLRFYTLNQLKSI